MIVSMPKFTTLTKTCRLTANTKTIFQQLNAAYQTLTREVSWSGKDDFDLKMNMHSIPIIIIDIMYIVLLDK